MGVSLSIADAIEPLRGEWDELADRLEAPPHLYASFLEAWRTAIAPADSLHVVVARRGAALVGVLPLTGSRFGLSTPPRYGRTGGMASEPEVLDAMWVHALDVLRPGAVRLGPVEKEAPEHRALVAAAQRAGFPVSQWVHSELTAIDCVGDWETYLGGRSKNLRKDLRRRLRRLSESGEQVLEFHRGDAAEGKPFDELLVLEGSGWKGREGSAVVSSLPQLDFYRALARWTAARDALGVSILRFEGKPIAANLAIDFHGVSYQLKSGYDERQSAFSPGKLLLAADIEQAFDNGISTIDLGGHAEEYKLPWTTSTQSVCEVEAYLSGPRGGVRRFARQVHHRVSNRTVETVA
ncbi:MAG: GNAT family N-acetyltransferase [Miltoncostaeaceae bacterium]